LLSKLNMENCTLWQSFGFSVGLWGFGNVCNVGRQLFQKMCGGQKIKNIGTAW